MIAFVGSVFSPTYFRARRRDTDVDPADHCGFNVVIHGPGGDAWAFSEYGRADVERGPDHFVVGRNRIERDDGGLTVTIDERTSPWGRALRGTLRIDVDDFSPHRFTLDAAGRHQWWPVAPSARVRVELSHPALRFTGAGYHDTNSGTEALEHAFAKWTWSRSSDSEGTSILYDVTPRDGDERRIGVRIGSGPPGGSNRLTTIDAEHGVDLGRSRWGLERHTRVAEGGEAQLIRPLVDAPFYARSLFRTTVGERSVVGVHEIVDLDRFVRKTTQLMLPFRTRGAGWF